MKDTVNEHTSKFQKILTSSFFQPQHLNICIIHYTHSVTHNQSIYLGMQCKICTFLWLVAWAWWVTRLSASTRFLCTSQNKWIIHTCKEKDVYFPSTKKWCNVHFKGGKCETEILWFTWFSRSLFSSLHIHVHLVDKAALLSGVFCTYALG